MNSIATGITAALVSGVVMYSVGANAPLNAFNQNPALVQTLDGQFVPASTTTALRPAAVPSAPAATRVSNSRRASAPAPRRTVASAASAPSRQVYRDEEVQPERSWGKTAMVIGGSAAGGAGVGGIVGGKKGALIGAAIGGGAASIFEATQRR
jgi:hypothetical protein